VIGSRVLQLGALAPAGYGAFVAYVTATAPASLSPEARRWLPAVLAATHLAWGSGFLVGRR
jgi:succinoglycan biosynthesis protein ExoA